MSEGACVCESVSGPPGEGLSRLGWGVVRPGGCEHHERATAEDWSGAQHHGHGHQLDVSDATFPRGAQRHHRVPRRNLREDRQRA